MRAPQHGAHAVWTPPTYLPVFFDVPEAVPARRITIRADMSPSGLALAIIKSAGWLAVLGGTLLVLYNTATILVPLALGAAIDHGIGPVTDGTPPSEAVWTFVGWLAVIAGLYLLINLTYRFGGRIGWYTVQRAKYELSARVVERILDIRGTANGSQLPGRLLSVATADSDRTSSAIYFAIYPLGNVVGVVVAAVSLFTIHPILGVIVVVGSPLLLVVMALVAKPLRKRAQREQQGIADAARRRGDLVSGYRVITGIHAQRSATGHYRRVSRSALRATLSANTSEGAVIGINAALTAIFAGVVTAVAAVLAFHGSVSIGGLIAAAAMAQVLLDPLRTLIEEAAVVGAMVLASARRVLDQLHADPDPEALGNHPVSANPTLRITSTNQQEPIDIEPGTFAAINPTAVDVEALVAALTLTSHGDGQTALRVTLDGRGVREHDPHQVRATVLVAPHQSDLTEPTVIANITTAELVSGSEEHRRAYQALRAAWCEPLEQELPDGYATRLGDGGRVLSGGQRQRVALARAIFREPPILVLHDPTNAVDSATELNVATNLRAARAGLTTIVITSSPAFHTLSDRSINE